MYSYWGSITPCCGVMVRQWAGHDKSKLSSLDASFRIWTWLVVAVSSKKSNNNIIQNAKYHCRVKDLTQNPYQDSKLSSFRCESKTQTKMKSLHVVVHFLNPKSTHWWWELWGQAVLDGWTRIQTACVLALRSVGGKKTTIYIQTMSH